MKIGIVAGLLAFISSAIWAATPWQMVTSPVAGSPQSIGAFSNGCIIGAQPLAENSANYQIMRHDQRRYFGHPDLLAFIQRLGTETTKNRLGTLLIGDMGMPAGGRFSSGHASHQSGLDVDIWLQLPKKRWSPAQLSNPQPIDLVAPNGRSVVDRLWRPEIATLIELAAKDPTVTRIFVNPAIKLRLCEDTKGDRQWLRKIRPWFAHRAHMHVRLRCPASSTSCEDQAVLPAGDGCGAELTSWFQPAKPSTTPQEPKSIPPLPAGCQALLEQYVKVKS